MKKIILSLVMMAVAVTAAAQTVGDKMFVYYGGRVSDGFIPSEIDSIVYSNYDNDSIWYDDVVTQVIYTPDSVYRFPLAQIDSISFVRPATIYKPYAIVLEGEIRQYITSTDGFNLTMASNTPSRLLPKVGDRLVTMKPDDRFPYYFAGEVISATPSDDGIFLTCDTLEFEDVVEQFADIICAGSLEEESYMVSRKATTIGASTPWLPLLLPSFSNSIDFTKGGISVKPIPEIKELDASITFGAGMTYSIMPQARAKLTWFIRGGLFVSGIMVIDNSITWSHHFNGEVSGNVENSFLKSPKQGSIGSTPFSWYLDAGWFASLSGGLVWESSIERKTRTTLSFIYDRANPENNMARKFTKRLPVSDDISGKLYGDINAKAGVYVEAGVSLIRKDWVKVGVRASVGLKGEVHNLRLWEDINNADKSPNFYDNIKDAGITFSPFFRVGGVWGVAEGLPFGISGDFLNYQTNIGQPYNFYAIPSFDDIQASRVDPGATTVVAQASLGHQALIPVGVGFTAINSNGERVSTKYMSQTYSLFNQIPTASVELKNVPKYGKYRVCPMLRMFGHDVMASPDVELELENPVKITDFKQTGSQYKKDGFSHNGRTYSYKYDVAVTVSIENLEGVADWGYVYRDPNGKDKEISLLSHGTSYTDNSYAYFRDTSPAKVTLFGYVKYVGEQNPVYGEPKDYEVKHSLTSCPDDNHPHMIDLGLPSGTKWACCNVGAHSPEQYGGYYAWGEVSEKAVYNRDTYQYYNDYTGYINLGSDIAGTQYDVAHVKWGGSWVMPSDNQQVELLNNCSSVMTTENGVYGMRFTGPSGGSIFLPAAGYRWFAVPHVAGKGGDYWSSTQKPNDSDNAYYLVFSSGGACSCFYDERGVGQSVRPVVRN